jgi:hypothetical protein
MRYYLDFDRTIFDTDRFAPWVRSRFAGTAMETMPSAEFGVVMDQKITSKEFSFPPGELSQFLYPEVAGFLRDKENAVTIITFGNPTYQKAKAESAFYGIPRVSVMYTADVRKGAYLAPHTHLHQGAVLADDAPLELEILAASCPGLVLYEMRRDTATSDGRWPVVHSLHDLPNA